MKYLLLLSLVFTFFSAMSVTHAGHHAAETVQYVELVAIGNPADVLEVKVEKPRALNSGEVRVDVLAAPIHPSNLLQISGKYASLPKIPSTPGGEGVARVVEVSPEVKHLQPGQLVLVLGVGTWRQQVVAPAGYFIPLPPIPNASADMLAQLSMASVNPMAAHLMLESYVDLKEGDWIVQSASNSAVGSYLIQLAKQQGIKTINVVRREGLADELKAMGADVVLIDGPELAAEIKAASDNGGVKLAIDAVGGVTFSRLAESLEYGGTIVTYGVLSGKPVTLNPVLNIFNDVRVRGFWLSKWFETASTEEKRSAFAQIIPLVASGALRANVDSSYPLADIDKAVTRSAAKHRDGKVIILPNQ